MCSLVKSDKDWAFQQQTLQMDQSDMKQAMNVENLLMPTVKQDALGQFLF